MNRLGFFFFFVFAHFAFADARAEVETLTVQKAVETALSKNPTVLAAKEKLNEMESSKSTAYSALFPNLSVVGNGAIKKDAATNPNAIFGAQSYNNYTLGVNLNQPVYMGNLLSGQIHLAKTAEEMAQRDYSIVARDTSLAVIQAFYAVLLAEHQVAVLEENVQIDEDLVKTINSFHKLGRSQLLDVLQVKTQLALLVPKVAQAKNQVKIAAIQLATDLGYGDAPELHIKGTLFKPDRKKLEAYFKTTTPRIYEIEKADQQINQVDAQKDVTLSKEYPSLSVIANWGRSAYVKTDLLDSSADNYSLGLQLTIPIFSGLSSIHERATAASQLKQAEINKAGQENLIVFNQVQAQKQLDLAEETLGSSEAAFKIAQKSLDEAKRQFRLGLSNLLQYISSEQSFLDSETAFEQAKNDYLVNLLKYGSARGYDPQKLLEQIGG